MPRMGMNTSEPDSNSWVTINKDVQRISLPFEYSVIA